MIKVEHSVVIDRPVEEVFAFVAAMENEPQWQSGVDEVHSTSEGPMGVGSTWFEVMRILGRRIETHYVVTEYEPNRKLSMKSTSGPVSMEGSMTFESAGGGTRMDITGQGDAKGFFKLAEPVLGRIINRQFEADLGNLKDLLEAQATG